MPVPPLAPASVLALLLALSACSGSTATADADRSPADTTLSREAVAAYPTPSVVLIGRAGPEGSQNAGGQLFLRFRGEGEVVLSPAPLVITTGAGVIEAAFLDGPNYSREGEAVVSAATYALNRDAFLALSRSGESAELTVAHADQTRTYPLVRADLLE